MQLAIDTSTDILSLALAEDGQVIAELSWRSKQNHSTELLPQLNNLLNLAGVEIKSISHVIIAKGPGSYNGLRVGVSTAKGLAFSLKIPIVGISTLEAQAYQHSETGLPICPILNAGRGELATASYQKKNGKWLKLSSEHLATVESLCSEIATKTIFCGEIKSIANQLKRKLKSKAVLASPASQLRRAAFLLELGQKRLKAGAYDNPTTLQPLYLRLPPITKPKRKIEWRGK